MDLTEIVLDSKIQQYICGSLCLHKYDLKTLLYSWGLLLRYDKLILIADHGNSRALSCPGLTINRCIDENHPAHGWGGSAPRVVVLPQHVVCICVGPPCLGSVCEVGVAPSICHLPPARGVRGLCHAMCLTPLLLVIQTEGDLGRMEKVHPRSWGNGVGDKC